MPIYLNKKKMHSRNNEIRKLLIPLSNNQKNVASKASYSPRGSIILAAFGNSTSSTNHKDWFFKTHKVGYNASYFEAWKEKDENFILEKAYFKLMYNKNNLNKEILSLHIDPTETIDKYKNGPHIHIKTSNDIISKAHISLNLSNLEEVVNSFNKFNEAYKNALLMINNEVLLKFD